MADDAPERTNDPCKFCGAPFPAEGAWQSRLMGGWVIECDNCHIAVLPQARNEAEAIAAWNRRPLLVPPPGERP